jgi:hypothetical protein
MRRFVAMVFLFGVAAFSQVVPKMTAPARIAYCLESFVSMDSH